MFVPHKPTLSWGLLSHWGASPARATRVKVPRTQGKRPPKVRLCHGGTGATPSRRRASPHCSRRAIPLFKVFMAPAEEVDGPVTQLLHRLRTRAVEEFEEALRRFFGNPRVLTLNSHPPALGAPPAAKGGATGLAPTENVDEVLTRPLTCTATNWPTLPTAEDQVGRRGPDDVQHMPADLSELSPTTKVIMLVHWGGTPSTSTASRTSRRCLQRFGFRPRIIEDCAHAIGAEQRAEAGLHGNMCVFSCRPSNTSPPSTAASPSPTRSTSAASCRAGSGSTAISARARRLPHGARRPEYGFVPHERERDGRPRQPAPPPHLEACRATRALRRALPSRPASRFALRARGTNSAWWLYTVRVPADWRPRFFDTCARAA